MLDGEIRVEHLWKRFKADHRMLLRDEMLRAMAKMFRRTDEGWRWALRDINIEIAPGESVGLIGVNGSGKTTLLKLMSKVMVPYAGKASVGGRVGALLGVVAGLHQDLTGRENVFIYGSLLGWTRKAVAVRFEDIVEFAELGSAIDRQVKFYSSGMQMRLAFSIAAMLEPRVLLVDEVLAVGDASFQQKSLSRMREILAEGATLVYVSHDLSTVKAMCKRTIWLDNGVIVMDGETEQVISSYLRSLEGLATLHIQDSGPITFNAIKVSSNNGPARPGEKTSIVIEVDSAFPWKGRCFIGISQTPISPAFVVSNTIEIQQESDSIACDLDYFPLVGGTAYLWVGLVDSSNSTTLNFQIVGQFETAGESHIEVPTGVVMGAPIYVGSKWKTATTSRG